METLLAFDPILLVILAILSVLSIFSFLMMIFARVELSRIKERYDALIEYLGDGESKDILLECANTIRNLEYENRVQEKELSEVFSILSSCVQKVSIIRYNAFDNVGSDLSYSIALLDNEDNGVVLSSLYGRESSTAYAKPITSGQSKYVLTEEEREAISSARKNHIGRSYFADKPTKESDAFDS